jgi:Zn-dependent protease with chaperone function
LTNDEFRALVARLEGQARKNPGRYNLRVVLLAFAGYSYLWIVVVVLMALLIGSLLAVYTRRMNFNTIIWFLALLNWFVIKAMWIRIHPPEGIEVARQDAPALFAMIEGLRAKLRSKRFHHVLITNEFNAAVMQLPRLGLLGWHRNYLLVGLPLMRFLTPRQLEAVLAHEFGHLAGGHGRMSNWIYRLRLSFHRVLAVLEQERSFGTYLFKPFFEWYSPYFDAYSFPLARANEYHADAESARLVSPAVAAEALTNVEVVASYLQERYWPDVHRRADDLPAPSFAPFAAMNERDFTQVAVDDVHRWLTNAIARPTTESDTHPGLADRLKAMGQDPRVALPVAGHGADDLLGKSLARIAAYFDQRWKEAIAPAWTERFENVRRARERLAELAAVADGPDVLPIAQALEHARLVESWGEGPQRALALYRSMHERAPDNAAVNFLLGERLLAKDDEAGFAMIQAAMAADSELALASCEVLRDHCWRVGREAEAKDWHAKAQQHRATLEAARSERETLLIGEKFERHGLSNEVIAGLRAQLKALKTVRIGYFVRRRLTKSLDPPQYLLGYVVGPIWKWRNKQAMRDIQKQILATVTFPIETMVFCVEGDNRRFWRKLRWMRGSRIL